MQLIQHQELETTGGPHELFLPRPGHHQFQHHIVGEDDIRWVGDDLQLFFVTLLARVAPEGDRRLVETPAQELFQLVDLAVCQGVHGIDHDRLDPLAASPPQDVFDDRNDVGQALARPCPGGQDIAVAGLGRLNRIRLVLVQAHSLPDRIFGRFLDAEYLLAERMQNPLGYQVIDPFPGLKVGIELDKRVRPKDAITQLLLHVIANTLILNFDKTLDVGGIVLDEMVAKRKDIHQRLLIARAIITLPTPE